MYLKTWKKITIFHKVNPESTQTCHQNEKQPLLKHNNPQQQQISRNYQWLNWKKNARHAILISVERSLICWKGRTFEIFFELWYNLFAIRFWIIPIVRKIIFFLVFFGKFCVNNLHLTFFRRFCNRFLLVSKHWRECFHCILITFLAFLLLT